MHALQVDEGKLTSRWEGLLGQVGVAGEGTARESQSGVPTTFSTALQGLAVVQSVSGLVCRSKHSRFGKANVS